MSGIALLTVFGRRGYLGDPLSEAGITLSFTTAAVVLAQLFVAAPYYVRAAYAGFSAMDPRFEGVAYTLGLSRWRTFRSVTLPLVWPALAGGAVLCWARALGELGATLLFAGSLPGRTQTGVIVEPVFAQRYQMRAFVACHCRVRAAGRQATFVLEQVV